MIKVHKNIMTVSSIFGCSYVQRVTYLLYADVCASQLASYLETIIDMSQQMSTRLYMENSQIIFVIEFVQLFCRILNEDCDGSNEGW